MCVPVEQKVNKRPVGAIMSPPRHRKTELIEMSPPPHTCKYNSMFACAERHENRPTRSDAVMSKNQSRLLVMNTKCVWRNVFYGVLRVWNRTAVFVPSYDITRRWRLWPRWANEGARHAVSCSTVNWAWPGRCRSHDVFMEAQGGQTLIRVDIMTRH